MATKAASLTEDKIIELFMHETLESEHLPKSVFKFCKTHKLQESDFYKFFGSFESLQDRIWIKFYENTRGLLDKNEEYAGYSNREKMLTFFYTFFELLTLNRSYVLFVIAGESNHSQMDKMKQLRGLRSEIKAFSTELIEEANEEKNYKITQRNPRIFSEGSWVQFLFLLRFWMDDKSAGFEKTDMAIEKSVNTIFDLFDNTPLDTIIDFGKFLYKETGL